MADRPLRCLARHGAKTPVARGTMAEQQTSESGAMRRRGLLLAAHEKGAVNTRISTETAFQHIVPLAPLQCVIANTANEHIMTGIAKENVISGAAIEAIRPAR